MIELEIMPKNKLVRNRTISESEKLGADVGYAIEAVKEKSNSGVYQWRHKLNASIKFNINQALVGEVINIDSIADAIELLKERLFLDGYTMDDVENEMRRRNEVLGSYSKRLNTIQDIALPNALYKYKEKGHYINHLRYNKDI